MTAAKNLRKLPTTSPDAAAEAREQADEYESLFGTTDLELDNGDDPVKIPPHPDFGIVDDDRIAAYEQLLFERDTEYEREPDIFIPERQLGEGSMIPAETIRGALRHPYRRRGEDGKSVLVSPPFSVQVARAALGDEEYDRLRAGGRSAADVWKIWGIKSLKMKERQAGDSKSIGSALALASVPETDSQ